MLVPVSHQEIIQKLADTKYSEAFYICDVTDIAKKVYNWRALMPRVEPHYAVKCNSEPIVVKVLAALGLGFDCASQQEIKQILALGVKPEKIIFANPTKILKHIEYAHNSGVRLMTFDSEVELYKVKQTYPSNAKMVLRIKHDDPQAFYQLGKKFGCDPLKDAPKLLKLARSLGIDVVGVCFHIGSMSNNPAIYREAIADAAHVFKVAQYFGFKPDLLDIGGGFPGERDSSIDEMAKVINESLEEFFPDPSVRVISEPGRYFVNSAFTLATKIHSVKFDGDTRHFDYYIDTGVYQGFISVLCNEAYNATPLNISKNPDDLEDYHSTVWGPTCDCFDKVTEARLPKLGVGDWLVFENVGAYTASIASTFNGFDLAGIHGVINKKTYSFLKDKVELNELNVHVLE